MNFNFELNWLTLSSENVNAISMTHYLVRADTMLGGQRPREHHLFSGGSFS